MRSVSLLIIFTIFPITLLAAQVEDAKKCTSIVDPNDRLQCYDLLFKKAKNKQQQTTNKGGASKINADIMEILNIPLNKGEFETTQEFNERIRQIYEKYDGRVYDVALDISKYNTDREKLVYYDPDTEKLTVSMPDLDFVTIGLQVGDQSDDERLTLSFLETKSLEQNISKYKARNSFGNEVEVVKAVFRDIGLAILGQSNRDMDGQSFQTTVPREKARLILNKGQVLITVKTDLIKKGDNSFMLDNWMTFMSKGASILVSEKDERDPTMSDPRHVMREKLMLPVRLVSMRLLDEGGRDVFSGEGTEISTNYYNE